jgi:hypothetical protein
VGPVTTPTASIVVVPPYVPPSPAYGGPNIGVIGGNDYGGPNVGDIGGSYFGGPNVGVIGGNDYGGPNVGVIEGNDYGGNDGYGDDGGWDGDEENVFPFLA